MQEPDIAPALQALAAQVVTAELERLERRLPALAAPARAELDQTLRRVIEQLLRPPTERIQPGRPGADRCAQALRLLFDLNTDTPTAAHQPLRPPPSTIGIPTP